MKNSTGSAVQPADFIQAFLIDHSAIRGQFVRLDNVANAILSRHQYPDIVSLMLAEMLVVATMLAQNLKPEGILTIQAKGDGPLAFLVVDAISGGDIRGYAEMKEGGREKLEAMAKKKKTPNLSSIFGKGYLAITLDQGASNERYQGIVELEGATLSEAMQKYFTQSQQVEMHLKMAVELTVNKKGDAGWRAAGIMVERMPYEGGKAEQEDQTPEQLDDQWNMARLFIDTLQNVEMLEPGVSSWTLLTRLFGEEGVWAYPPREVHQGCRCSRERISTVLQTIPEMELEEMLDEDKRISVNCQFCNNTEWFSHDEIKALYQ